ncbi:MAG: NAD-dependent epimerase/dehydratase family protein [Paludibacter sp.]
MNILITGIHGFIGSNLVAALKAQHTIYGLDIVAPPKEGVVKTFSWNELESIPAVDVVIHLAGKAHDTKNQTNAQVYFEINTGLTQKIYDWFLKSEAQKFIFFSSVKAAADKVEGEILTENVIPSPKGPYGESKIKAEEYILSRQSAVGSQQSRAKSQEPREIDELSTKNRTYILRPCMIHGPGNKGNLNLLYQVVKKRIPYPLGAFENRRSFTSIDNLSFVIEQLIEKDVAGGIYNVGDDESLSTNELISLMAWIMGKPDRIWKWNKSLVLFAAKIGTVFHLPLNTERLQKLTENYVVSNAKLKKALGIDMMPVRAEEGLRKTINSL